MIYRVSFPVSRDDAPLLIGRELRDDEDPPIWRFSTGSRVTVIEKLNEGIRLGRPTAVLDDLTGEAMGFGDATGWWLATEWR